MCVSDWFSGDTILGSCVASLGLCPLPGALVVRIWPSLGLSSQYLAHTYLGPFSPCLVSLVDMRVLWI